MVLRGDYNSRWGEYKDLGVDLYSLSQSRLKGLLFARYKLNKLISDIKPDLIHTQGIRADIILSNHNIRIPHIATIHNFPQVDYQMNYGQLLSKIMLKKHIASMRMIDQIIGCSDSVANNLINSFGLNNVVGIQNGVDQEQFFANNLNFRYIRTKLRLDDSSIIWISTGHLSTRKDPAFLIKQWNEFIKVYSNHHLVFLGSGELYDDCTKLSSGNNNIHFLGRVSNVKDYLQGSDYFVSASKAEGLPMATIEALACGLPVLLSNIEPHAEVYNMSPNIGQLFKLGDNESFLDSFKLMVESNYLKQKNAALDLIAAELSASKMSQKYQSTYHKLLGA